ncbi:Endothelin-converting enzyme-like protein [Frankliniella fusca]|uniref:Endothelin-converting enzyme-like protein n=1 Tax=Frankliniella fusca TaxID=407009 RepID=A0AAE1H1U4_9NEOP|nr:Endothelin-converting enzyme-like protein [Frankliniella fusca]
MSVTHSAPGSTPGSAPSSAPGSSEQLVTVSSRKAGLRRLLDESRRLLLVAAVLGLLAVVLLISLIVVSSLYYASSRFWNREECRSQECIQSAAMLLQGIDPGADPCQDFYRYTCGRWPKAHPVLDSHIYNSWFLERQDAQQRKVIEVLQVNVTDRDPEPVVMAHRFFKSCTDTEQMEELGLDPMLDLLSNLSLPRGMPSNATARGWQLAKTLAAAQRFISKDILVEIGLEKDDTKPDNETLIMHLLPPQNNNPLPDSGLVSLVASLDLERELPPWPRPRPHAGPTAVPAQLSSKELVVLRVSYMSKIMAIVDAAANADNPDFEIDTSEVSTRALQLLLLDSQLNSATTQSKDPAGEKPLRTTFRELQQMMMNATAQAPTTPPPPPSAAPDHPDAMGAVTTEAAAVAGTPPGVGSTTAAPSPAEVVSAAAAPDKAGLAIDFAQYLEVLLDGLNATIDVDNDPILVTDPAYFKAMAVILRRSKPESIQRLVWWKVVETVSPHTVQLFRDMKHTLLSTVYKGLQPTSRHYVMHFRKQLTWAMVCCGKMVQLTSHFLTVVEIVSIACLSTTRGSGRWSSGSPRGTSGAHGSGVHVRVRVRGGQGGEGQRDQQKGGEEAAGGDGHGGVRRAACSLGRRAGRGLRRDARFIHFLTPAHRAHLTPVFDQLGPRTRADGTLTKFCVRAVKTFMHMAVSYQMAVVNPLRDTVSKVREMLADITAAFGDLVEAVRWMDADTKHATLDKAAAIRAFIGYPDWLLEAGELERFYEGVRMRDDQFLWNMLNMKAREVKGLLGALAPKDKKDQEKDKDRWATDPIEVNAFYSRAINSIASLDMCLSMRSYPCRDSSGPILLSRPGRVHDHSEVPPDFKLILNFSLITSPRSSFRALNYGSIGAILGHELTHGFDIEGKEYDKKGLRNSWWRPDVTKEYNERAQCFVKQYDAYNVTDTQRVSSSTEPSRQSLVGGSIRDIRLSSCFPLGSRGGDLNALLLQVNGTFTLAENIADNGGIREAYLGYRRYTARHGREPTLPGLNNYTHEQLFFLAFANVWCHNSDAQFDALQLRDSHSPARFRVIGALSNFPEFAETWSCPTGSPMHPANKCIICGGGSELVAVVGRDVGEAGRFAKFEPGGGCPLVGRAQQRAHTGLSTVLSTMLSTVLSTVLSTMLSTVLSTELSIVLSTV